MAPSINDPGGDKNDPDEIRDGVVFGLDFEDRTGIYGGFTVEDEHDAIPPMQQPGGLNSGYGQFRDDAPPDLVLFTTGTTNDIEGHLDIIGPLGG